MNKWQIKCSEVKAGDMITPGDGFGCMECGTPKEVKSGENGGLYVDCNEGQHYLDMELDEGEQVYINYKKL